MKTIEKTIELNKKWWLQRLADRELTYRSLAARVDLSGPDVSRIINSQRNIKVEEAERIAKALKVDLAEVLKRATAQAPLQRYEKKETKGSPYVNIIGWVDASGHIIKGEGGVIMDRRVVRPARMGADTVAVRIMAPGLVYQWIAYYQKLDYVHDKAVRALCVVETVDGRWMFRRVMRGPTASKYELLNFDGEPVETTGLKTASPVLWMKQE